MAAALTARPTPLRLAAGFALAPLVVPIAWVVLVAALGELPDASDLASARCVGFALDVAICLGIGYGSALLLGVPLVLALRWARLLVVPWTLAGGALAGAAVSAAALLAMGSPFRSPDVVAAATAVGFALALVVAGIFCAVAGVPLRRVRLPAVTSASLASSA